MNIQIGTIAKWNDDKGFGFITPKSGGRDIFVHINDYSRTHKKPSKGLKVNYFISTDPKGRKCAIEVRPLSGHKNNGHELRQKTTSILLILALACLLYFLYSSNLIPLAIIGLYAVMSILTFAIYAKDKNAAEWETWRTPESRLHMLSLLGGWPGAAVAQSYLRHKSQKFSFKVTFWVTVIANCAGLYLLTTPQGNFWFKNLLRNINIG